VGAIKLEIELYARPRTPSERGGPAETGSISVDTTEKVFPMVERPAMVIESL